VGDVEQEGLEDLFSARCMRDLGVELQAVDAAGLVGDGAERGALARAERLEARRHGLDAIAVAHPHLDRLALGEALKDARGPGDGDRGGAILALGGALDAGAEQVSGELEPVTDAQDGHADIEERGVHARRARAVDAGRAAREDDRPRGHPPELAQGEVEGMDLAVHAALADPARDELGVLRSEIEDQDCAIAPFEHACGYHGRGRVAR
jgi:hypothetical protein